MNRNKFVFDDKQLSYAASTVLLICFICFALGYIMGKRVTIHSDVENSYTGSLSDNVSSAVYSVDFDTTSPGKSNEFNETNTNIDENHLGSNENGGRLYFARLIGFSSKKNAQACLHKWQKKGFDTQLIERSSKSVKGKTVNWYQLVTHQYHDKADLNDFINKLKSVEQLNDIEIVTV